jgi:hypothetical protein
MVSTDRILDQEEHMAISPATVAEIALSLPGAREGAHFDVTDFRVGNKIFCTLPKPGRTVVRIAPEEQAALISEDPETFSAPQNSYGRNGWTFVSLAHVDEGQLRELITDAWRRLASRKLIGELESRQT